jgi:integrase
VVNSSETIVQEILRDKILLYKPTSEIGLAYRLLYDQIKAKLSSSEPQKQLTLSQWLHKWLDRYPEGRGRDSYESICRNHIIPALGEVPLHELTAPLIREFIDSLQMKLSQTTKSHIRACLHTSLEAAVEAELISSNPVSRIHVPLRFTSSHINPLRQEELDILLKARDIPYYELIHTAAMSGLRQGELLALPWKNVDLAEAMIRVTRSLDAHNGRQIFKECKNKHSRSISLFRISVDILEKYREYHYSGQDGLVFCCPDGSPLNGAMITKSFSDSLEKIGLRHIRFHDLRHTHATQLLMANFPVKVVQERLGHQSAQMTIDLYGHFIPGMQDKFVRDFEAQRFLQETAEEAGASDRNRTYDKRFTKPLLYP